MKIDQDYVKRLLDLFETCPIAEVNINYLNQSGINNNTDNFVFHMRILQDGGFITRCDGRPGFGMEVGLNGHRMWSCVPLRLTAKGHDFIEALHQKEVWEALKKNFKDASISTMSTVAKQLAAGFAKKKIKDITGIDID
ncbi:MULTISPECIES: DUF2513 domain-containing protein [Serratia]|uniref:DUF2513 domain-containing protein n=1 Tax=Serratia TaxID=613 RepID=UPI000760A345|nr:DUF2513 domain-containing protein [Serratia marcescens]HEJ7159845.1 DUF2513 domain-containing protein [Serratia marcescens]HEJ8072823.1 DUF2513 domain-containing protein [Serratia marcescens]HEJ9008313.1 DUF2513 domain-containing protein [Serratia marcescens]HEM7587213.1 DUF2513 domain-containing protein [Serratia marcescens]